MDLGKLKGLKDLLSTLKKNPTRTYTEQYIQEIEAIWEYYNQSNSTKEQQFEISLKLSDITAQIRRYLKPKGKTEETMANFELTAAIKIIPQFEGNIKDVSNFIGLIDFYAETLKDTAEKSKLIKFILATNSF